MTARSKYAIPVDVLRRVDSSIEQADIGDEYSISASRDTILAHIEGVEAEFERRAIELTNQQVTDELHEGVDRDFGYTIYLDESNVKPLDPSAGDSVEIRTGDDTFTDVTDQAFLDRNRGVIEIDRRFIQREPYYPEETNYRFRVSYRFGGSADQAGESTVDEAITASAQTPLTVGVSEASEFEGGNIVLLGDDEYALVTGVDETAGELTVGQRGLRGTEASAHEAGDQVVHLPLDIRDAISAEVASRLLRQDDFLDTLNEGAGDSMDTSDKIEQLEAQFENTVSQYTTSAGYV